MQTSKDQDKQAKENKKKKQAQEDAMVDQTLEDSFPASDPPAWYGGKDKK